MLFQNIIGQSEIKERLIYSVQKNRVSHSQLFLGDAGSGALPLAVAYTQYILCKNRNEKDACGICPSCRKSNKLIHPDIHFVYPVALKKGDVEKSTDIVAEWRESFLENPYLNLSDWFSHLNAENKQPVIGVEESGEILHKLLLTTYEGEFKVVIIWMPEKMNISAANKLLKILEEPSDKTLFLLVTENEEQLLRTIVSRTQLVKVNRISDEEMRNTLMEKYNIERNEATRIVYLADGNFNAALKLLNQRQEENYNLIQFRQLMRICFNNDVIKAINQIEEIAKIGKEKQKSFLHYGLNILRECLIANYGDNSLMRIEGEELEFVKGLSTRIDGTLCKKLIDELNEGIIHIERNGNSKLVFTDLSLKCMKIIKQM
ncbi:MAG: hypothetical protein V1781_05800 [Bacteroidota bacterium]